MLIADLSEFVYFTDAKAYAAGKASDGTPYQVVILRVSYSNNHLDEKFVANLAQARAAGLTVFFYFYLAQGVDPASQGTFFANQLKANGGLKAGEGFFCDCEEGSGNLAANVSTAIGAAHAILKDPTQDEGEYSGSAFFTSHLGTTSSALHRWIAAYGVAAAPALGEPLWQFTDSETMPGISAKCDCSIYNGTLDQLKALFSPASGGGTVVSLPELPAYGKPGIDLGNGVTITQASGGAGTFQFHQGGAGFYDGTIPTVPLTFTGNGNWRVHRVNATTICITEGGTEIAV